jgi:hypothetical protein
VGLACCCPRLVWCPCAVMYSIGEAEACKLFTPVAESECNVSNTPSVKGASHESRSLEIECLMLQSGPNVPTTLIPVASVCCRVRPPYLGHGAHRSLIQCACRSAASDLLSGLERRCSSGRDSLDCGCGNGYKLSAIRHLISPQSPSYFSPTLRDTRPILSTHLLSPPNRWGPSSRILS